MFWCYAFGVSVGVVKHYLPIVWHTILFTIVVTYT